ncbi:MAG: hypothetical protein IPK16_16155 [Anaerolineales bacterium]|nr:hypothetical protein [Anaerolineales bacterium]
MNRDVGDKTCPIWLLGDSNPSNWQDVLVTPLDPRHPARHSIWTPVLDVMQDRVFRKQRLRIDTSSIYILQRSKIQVANLKAIKSVAGAGRGRMQRIAPPAGAVSPNLVLLFRGFFL